MNKVIKTESFKSAMREIFAIVVGVLLALAVNEWNENRIQTARANEAISNIIQEIESNLNLLQIVNKNNLSVVALVESEKSENNEETQNLKFIPGLQIQDTAWQTLLSTGVSEFIEFSTLYDVSSIYSLQAIYRKLGFQLVESMMSNQALAMIIASNNKISNSNDLYLTNMKLILEIEKALLSNYQEKLKKLKPTL